MATPAPLAAPLEPSHQWLSLQEAADYLGVTRRTIRNYIDRGALAGYQPPGSRLVRVDRAELDAMLQPMPRGRADG